MNLHCHRHPATASTGSSTLFPLLGLLLAAALPAAAQTTVSLNLDYAEGKYGEPDKSSSWTMPLIVKHQAGALGLKLNIPYIRATGTAAAGGDRFSPTRQTQEGWGDVTATVAYDIYHDTASGTIIDLAAKAKFATADKAKDLITTGKNDYSLLIDGLRPFGATTVFATLGWTKKGDPDGVAFRNPLFSTLGLSHKLSGQLTLGAVYDYRQKVTAHGDPVSEATLFVERKFDSQYKLQGYLVRGFSDASPDIGAGITVSARF